MKKLWIIIPFLIILTIFCFNLIVEDVSQTVEDVSQNKDEKIIFGVREENVAGQTFVSNHNNLCAIEVFLATYNMTITEDVIFHLKLDPEAEDDIITLVVNASTIEDNRYYRFEFKPIEKSECKSYYFFLEFPKAPWGNALYVIFSTKDEYEDGSIYINYRETDGDLRFRTYFQTNFLTKFLDRVRALQDKPFFVFYISLMAISTLLLLKHLEKKLPLISIFNQKPFIARALLNSTLKGLIDDIK